MHRNDGNQTGNLYKYTSSVKFQRCDAYIYIYIYSIDFQCGGPVSRCIYSIPKLPSDNQIDRHKITKDLQMNRQMDGQAGGLEILCHHSGDLYAWPAASCSGRKAELR